MKQKYNVVMTPQDKDTAAYGGFFGHSEWSPGSCQRAWHFTSIPVTGCCGFGLLDKSNFHMFQEEVEAFIKQAHFSGFIIDQKFSTPFDPNYGVADIISPINKAHEGVFTLHHFNLEDNLQLFIAEIHDIKKFENWKHS